MAAVFGNSMNLAMRPQNTLRLSSLRTLAPRTGRASVHVQAVSSVFKRNKAPTKPVSLQKLTYYRKLSAVKAHSTPQSCSGHLIECQLLNETPTD
jgi:hypothetical protein